MREICLDTETTGLSFKDDRIVEIGCVELLDRLPTGRVFHRFVNPEREISARAMEIHGLSLRVLQDHPVFREHAADLLDFIRDDVLVIHNASFDLGMLNAELDRLCLPALMNPVVDTWELSKKVRPGKKHNLDALMGDYGISVPREKHGALLDAEILAAVYLELTGGRQRGLDLVVEQAAPVVLPADYGPRPFVSRLTPAEAQAHALMVEHLGPGALWRQYLGME